MRRSISPASRPEMGAKHRTRIQSACEPRPGSLYLPGTVTRSRSAWSPYFTMMCGWSFSESSSVMTTGVPRNVNSRASTLLKAKVSRGFSLWNAPKRRAISKPEPTRPIAERAASVQAMARWRSMVCSGRAGASVTGLRGRRLGRLLAGLLRWLLARRGRVLAVLGGLGGLVQQGAAEAGADDAAVGRAHGVVGVVGRVAVRGVRLGLELLEFLGAPFLEPTLPRRDDHRLAVGGLHAGAGPAAHDLSRLELVDLAAVEEVQPREEQEHEEGEEAEAHQDHVDRVVVLELHEDGHDHRSEEHTSELQ